MTRPASARGSYSPPEWEITVRVGHPLSLGRRSGPETLTRRVVSEGDHLAAAAQELLQLQVGFGPDRFGRLDPEKRTEIVIEISPLPEEQAEAGAMSASDGLGA